MSRTRLLHGDPSNDEQRRSRRTERRHTLNIYSKIRQPFQEYVAVRAR